MSIPASNLGIAGNKKEEYFYKLISAVPRRPNFLRTTSANLILDAKLQSNGLSMFLKSGGIEFRQATDYDEQICLKEVPMAGTLHDKAIERR